MFRFSSRGRATLGLALFVAAASGSASSLAEERARPLEPPRQAQAPEPLCFCWSDGRKIAEGARACIRTTQGRRMASCGRVLNMMSWEVSPEACPES